MGSHELLEMRGVTKIYGKTTVLDNVNFSVKIGEVHALVGENGAGKSTLMKILCGNVMPESGVIYIDGKQRTITNSKEAHENGISIVYQELVQAPLLSVAENIYMGRVPHNKAGFIYRRELNKRAKSIMERIHAEFSPDARLDSLSIAQRQMVEILKALSYDVKIIIFDEPTSSLTKEESEKLFEIINQLRKEGTAVIYISHRMEEIFRLSDRITVLRDGHMIRTLETKNTSEDEIIPLLVGRDLSNMYPKEEVPIGEEILRVENLRNKYVDNISFVLHKGEILGFGGLVGAGRTETMLSLIGKLPYEGKVVLNGQEIRIKDTRAAINSGISYLTEDRKDLGVILGFEIYKNVTLSTVKKYSRYFFLNHRKEREKAQYYFDRLNILTESIDTRVRNLSGGNQQKVLLAKCLDSKPDVLILDEPTRGVDVGAKAEIYKIMSNLAKDGVAIIMISSELPELVSMSDRVVVMYEGRISGELEKDEITELNVMDLAARYGNER